MNKGDKIKEGLKIKDKIQKVLLKKAMNFAELVKYFDIDKKSMKNYLMSLKAQNVIVHYPGDMDKHINIRRYVGVPNKPMFSDLIKEQYKLRRLGSSKAKEKKEREKIVSTDKMTVTVISCNDYHTRGSHSKQSAWIGTTFGTMDY